MSEITSNRFAAPNATHIRATHPYSYRSGEWAEILSIAPAPDRRDCWIVRFPDGTTDFWVCNDPDAGYEFLIP